MQRSKLIITFTIWLICGCTTRAQNLTIDSSLEREILKAFKIYPEVLSSSRKSAYILVKVRENDNNRLEISTLNNSSQGLKKYIIENLSNIKFEKYLRKDETLLLPVFFLDIDSYENKNEYIKVDKLSFDILQQKEKPFEKVIMMRPFKIISPSASRTQ